MKKWMLALLICLLCGGQLSNTVYAEGADNVYVGPINSSPSDIVMSDWMPIQPAPYTYWATQNWNQGGEGGGYAGFQQDSVTSSSPRRLHFSIWDPIQSTLPIVSKYAMPGAQVSRFGGEGTGLKVMTPYSWQVDQWYRMVIRTWNEGCSGTCFGQWVKDVSNNAWTLVAVLDHPVPNIKLQGGLGLFQEDWAGTSQNVREARTKNGYNRKVDGTWNSWSTQRISSNHVLANWDGGATNEYFWFKAGGSTTPSISNPTTKTITQAATPVYDDILFANHQAKYLNGQFLVNWQMQNSSSPLFKYQISIYDNASLSGTPLVNVSEVKPEASSKAISAAGIGLTAGMTYYVKLMVTDVFDRTNSVTNPVTIGSSVVLDPSATYKIVNRNSGKIIDVPGRSTNNEVQLIQYQDQGGDNQRWSIVDTGNGYYKIVSKSSGKAIDVYEGSKVDGAKIVQYNDQSSNNQLWIIKESSSGYFNLVSKNSGKVIGVQNDSVSNDALLTQQSPAQSDSQQWSIQQVQ